VSKKPGHVHPASLLFLALFTVIPWLLLSYVDRASSHTRGAVNAIAGSSYARYQAWLNGLQRTDPALHSQIVLWHQGESARQMQQYQLALQAFNTYQLHRIRRDLRKD
jgi:hypothetical protein